MKWLTQNLAVVSILVLIVIGAGGYLVYSGNIKLNIFSNQDALAQARATAASEQAKLDSMNAKYNAERKVIEKIQAEYNHLRNTILRRTDIFFDDPNSDNPQFIIQVKGKDVATDINAKRLAITKLLNAWDEKYGAIIAGNAPSTTLADLVKSAQQDVSYVRDYINNLQDIISDLTTSNSNLTQTEINYFSNVIELNSNQVEEAVETITAIASEAQSIYVSTDTTATTTAEETTTTTTVAPTDPIVTQADINTQEQIVSDAQDVVSQIEEDMGISTTTTTVYIDRTILRYLPPTTIDRTGWPDIVPSTDPTKPSLLEGSNGN